MKTNTLFKTVLLLVALVGAFAWPAGAATTSADYTTLYTGSASRTVYVGSASDTMVPTTGFGTNLIAAKRWKVGDQLQIAMNGWATMGSNNAGNTVQIKVKAGKYTIANTQAMLLSSNSPPAVPVIPWKLECLVTCRTNGSTGFLIGQGQFQIQNWENKTNYLSYPITNIHGLILSTTTNIPVDIGLTYTDALGLGTHGTNNFTTLQCWMGLTR